MELMEKSETLALREKIIGKPCKLFFQDNPLKIVSAKGQYMTDETGKVYLDCINNVAHVGHCHPRVVKAGYDQMSAVNTNNRFLHDNIVLCAQRILSTMPADLSVCFFVNSGSEANDLALRLAQIHTGNKNVISLEHGYHGHLTSLIDISHYKFNLPGGVGKKDHVHVAPCPDPYRGKYKDNKYSSSMLGSLYSDEIQQICYKITESADGGVCAFIAESMISCGGQVIPPKNYFKLAYGYVRKAGGVCIADEVQVGFGRVGRHWWAFQHHDVVPDIVTMGKSMGNGHPVACVVTTRPIADSFMRTGVEYFNTYGGNPVSCAIASAVFDVIEEDNLRESAVIVGDYLLNSLQLLSKRHSIIGDVRGLGLFVGIDLVTDVNTRQPNKKCADFIVNRMREECILISAEGPEGNIIKLKPPMVFSKENVDELISTFDRVFEEIKVNEHISCKSILKPASTCSKVKKDGRPRKFIFDYNLKSI